MLLRSTASKSGVEGGWRFIQKGKRRCLLGGMKHKFAVAIALCVLLGLLTIVVFATKSARVSPKQKTQSGLVVTQDGKLTVLSPEGSANFKVVANVKSLTNTVPAPATNSGAK